MAIHLTKVKKTAQATMEEALNSSTFQISSRFYSIR
jgi:hypothetical protein